MIDSGSRGFALALGALACAACGGSLGVTATPEAGCASNLVWGRLALANGGGDSATVDNPTANHRFVAFDAANKQVDHGQLAAVDTVEPLVTVPPNTTLDTEGFLFWDASAQAPGAYGLQLTLSDGSTSKTTWFELPGCSPLPGP